MSALFGLRGKSVASLLLACLLALIPALLIGWKAVDEVRHYFASAYAEQYTLLQMQQIKAPLSRELALARRFADSVTTQEWLRDPEEPEIHARFLADAEGFRQLLSNKNYFIINHARGDYYFTDNSHLAATTESSQPRYQLTPEESGDAWYFNTMLSTSTYDISVATNQILEQPMIWINVKVRDNGELLGLAGTGIDLSRFLNRFIRGSAPGMTPMLIDSQGMLQAHPDLSRIALDSGNPNRTQRLQALVADTQQSTVQQAIHDAVRRPGTIVTQDVDLMGEPRRLSVGYIPELQWLLVTALDMQTAPFLDSRWFWSMMAALALVLTILMMVFAYAIHRLILSPLHHLKLSAQAIAKGDYGVLLPTERQDEIGELSQAFSHMAHQVERYTRNLEDQVRERTQDLEAAHAKMATAHKQLGDSIQYASIIQQAILPNLQPKRHWAHRYGVLWKPRDIVGGDFYVFRATEHGYLIGVVDCAGHGVPGALMTMLARAIIDHAIVQEGASDPAALLNEIDRQSRDLLPAERLPSSIATNMDIGLLWVNPGDQTLTYAGAKIDLYASDGVTLERLEGHKRALGHRRQARYENHQISLQAGWSYTLCSDGFLDQAGGHHGYGFGNQRFEAMLLAQAKRPLEAQLTAFEEALDAYRGPLPQRDDITLLILRTEPGIEENPWIC